jgi:isopentenyl-diphosphate delta-isomerase
MTERIIFADENDQQIGAGTREEAWAKGLYVRIVRVILKDEKGRVLSQLRGATKKSYPNCWTDSTSGHVDEGESYDESVVREMEEEIGVKTELSFVGKFASEDIVGDKTIREFNAIYEGAITSETPLKLEEGEVTEAKWFEISELKHIMDIHPEQFTLGFRETIKRFY